MLAMVGVLLAPLAAYAERITLAWGPSPGAVGYVVLYGTSSGVITGDVYDEAVVLENQTTFGVDGLTTGVRYYFVVVPYSSVGLGEPSSEVNGKPGNQPPTITIPGSRTVNPGAFTHVITASDPDDDLLVYSATGLPSSLAVNASTGVISGNVAAGVRAIITVTASDASLEASAPFTLSVVTSPLFTDEPLTPGVHVMRALHITELRRRIDALRATHGLLPVVLWTDATLGSGSTTIKVIHVIELRAPLDEVYSVRGRPPPTYTPLVAGSTVIKAVHIAELRAAVYAAEEAEE